MLTYNDNVQCFFDGLTLSYSVAKLEWDVVAVFDSKNLLGKSMPQVISSSNKSHFSHYSRTAMHVILFFQTLVNVLSSHLLSTQGPSQYRWQTTKNLLSHWLFNWPHEVRETRSPDAKISFKEVLQSKTGKNVDCLTEAKWSRWSPKVLATIDMLSWISVCARKMLSAPENENTMQKALSANPIKVFWIAANL